MREEGRAAADKYRAARAVARDLVPLALALAFQEGFAVAVMVLDRANRALPSDVLYVVLVESVAAAAFLAWKAARILGQRQRLEAAAAAPLEAALPAARGAAEEAWRDLAEAARREARLEAAKREERAKADLEAFLASVHALKTPATALSLMAERAERDGESLKPSELRLEIDELDGILDRTLGRLRLDDFERGSLFRPCDAAQAARASVRKHRRLLIARGIGVDFEGGFTAETDPSWLAFILDQAVSNAAKYARSRMSVAMRASGRLGTIEIGDDGPGFDPEDASRAFESSATGSAGRAAGASGAELPASSGYGLHLAAEAARRLGAVLELGSGRKGPGGAVLRLVLPLALDARDDLTTP